MQESIDNDWLEPWGDRRQEIVFIGISLDQEEVIRRLDQCLLTDEELLDEGSWELLPDPYDGLTFETVTPQVVPV